jgi:exodeoxyribonuclease-5/deoxyribonuclease V
MILAFDTYYAENKAKTVCIQFQKWTDPEPLNVYSSMQEGVEEYVPGEFYKRELPCILNLINTIDLTEVETIVVDGFVVLDDDNKPGLGAYLYDALQKRFSIIGVAKNDFATIIKNKRDVYRGASTRPLYVTAIGIPVDDAAGKIKLMHGNNRIPDLLKKLDMITRAAH